MTDHSLEFSTSLFVNTKRYKLLLKIVCRYHVIMIASITKSSMGNKDCHGVDIDNVLSALTLTKHCLRLTVGNR
jgi:hypothetical protein